ncbi:hypothetical protein F3Y22_tig00110271pilonHSYRG00126 [Hibiscus syriacus]|uniref:Integrase catalytic domain-containing protein n=1 Tax=Hibiscus syriacus TaxID=106335 RepID=A0A6A3B4D9_HIBSY|nr:hypothetical protein F3Y22_tig00110271pilonHSYRG00126 [Hibiscus syriacus]
MFRGSDKYGEGKEHWSGDLDSTVQQLHSKKVGYQGNGYLILSEFSKSMEIWKEKSVDFKNLQDLEVEECNSLKYIFTVSMALELVQLEHITVKRCPMMEYIIKKEAEENAMDTVWLPNLKMIRLESCSELKSFCMGNITLQCPSLHTIKVLCANLEGLELSSTNIQNLWPDEQHSAISSSVHKLTSLVVKGCHNLEYIVPSFLIKILLGLAQLSLFDCDNLEEVIFTGEATAEEEGITEAYWFTKLNLLELIKLPKLGAFCHGENSETDSPTQEVVFPNLIHLTIEGMVFRIGPCATDHCLCSYNSRLLLLSSYNFVRAVVVHTSPTATSMEFSSRNTKVFTNKRVNVVFDETNFLSWKQQILLTARSHRLERMLNGTMLPPPEIVVGEDGVVTANEEHEEFLAQDSALASWLLSTISPHLLPQFVGAETSAQVWNKVFQFFVNRSTTAVMSLHYMLQSLKKRGDSMRSYLTKVKEVTDALYSCGSPVAASEHIASILKGLTREYQPFIAVISAMCDTLSLDNICTMLIDAETQLEGFDYQPDSLPVSANLAQGKGKVESYKNQEKQQSRSNHSSYSRGRSRGRGRTRSRVQCQLCGKIGHLVSQCWHRFDEDFSGISIDDHTAGSDSSRAYYTATSNNESTCACCNHSSANRGDNMSTTKSQDHVVSAGHDQWIIDSGATHHVTPNEASLTPHSSYANPGKLIVGSGDYLPVHLVGKAELNTSSRTLALSNILHVPSITKNLLSVSKLAKENSVFLEFHAKTCYVRDEASKMVLLRLGHPAHDTLAKVCKQFNVKALDDINKNCIACHLGKSHKLPFPCSDSVYDKPFELVYSDLWGPPHVSSNGFRFYISFVDAATRFTWLYLLRTKDEALIAFNLFQKLIATQFGVSVKALQTDWGGEFRLLTNELSKAGVVHHVTCPYTSEQNGVVERKHKHLVEMALVLLAQASMPIKYWSYAIQTTAYLVNRLPSKVLLHKSPFEMLYGKPPDYRNSDGASLTTPIGNTSRLLKLVTNVTRLEPPRADHNRLSLSATRSSSVSSYQDELCSEQNVHNSLDDTKDEVQNPVVNDGTENEVAQANNHPMMTQKYSALQRNGTWELTKPPEGRKLIGCTTSGEGVFSDPGYDFRDTFSPVVRFNTLNVILSLAVTNNWTLRQVDVNNAFLNGYLQEVVFMQQPPGFEQNAPDGSKLVCCLKKALYGLRQAPRSWHTKLRDSLLSIGFKESKADVSLFIKKDDQHYVYLLVYVDDIIITGHLSDQVNEVVRLLSDKFSLKDLGQLTYFLRIEVKRANGYLALSQKKFILELLEKDDMLKASSTPTPMVASTKLRCDDGELILDAQFYHNIIGGLLYVCHTGPDIAFCVNKVAQFMHAPRQSHLVAVKRILRYLAGTLDFGLTFTAAGTGMKVAAFADADWGGNLDDRRSVSGHSVFVGNNLVAWSSKKQKSVSRSTMEAEYKSVTDTTADVVWVGALLSELGIYQKEEPVIWCDNTSVVALSANPVYHAHTKHVDLDIHFVREKVAAKLMKVNYVPAAHQIADGLTKPLARNAFEEFRAKLCVKLC